MAYLYQSKTSPQCARPSLLHMSFGGTDRLLDTADLQHISSQVTWARLDWQRGFQDGRSKKSPQIKNLHLQKSTGLPACFAGSSDASLAEVELKL